MSLSFFGRWCEEEEWLACSNVFSFCPVVWLNIAPCENTCKVASSETSSSNHEAERKTFKSLCWFRCHTSLLGDSSWFSLSSCYPSCVLSLWRFTTKKCRLASENFDRRCMSKHITTEVPTLLLRHPIRESLGGTYDYQWLPNSDSQKPSRSCHFVSAACSIRSLFVVCKRKNLDLFQFQMILCFFPLAWWD